MTPTPTLPPRAPSTRPQIICLAGFMGSGKTTVGTLLARQLAWRFVDLDERIESASGITIPQFFERFGEPAFRQLEADQLRAALGRASEDQTGHNTRSRRRHLRPTRLPGIPSRRCKSRTLARFPRRHSPQPLHRPADRPPALPRRRKFSHPARPALAFLSTRRLPRRQLRRSRASRRRNPAPRNRPRCRQRIPFGRRETSGVKPLQFSSEKCHAVFS